MLKKVIGVTLSALMLMGGLYQLEQVWIHKVVYGRDYFTLPFGPTLEIEYARDFFYVAIFLAWVIVMALLLFEKYIESALKKALEIVEDEEMKSVDRSRRRRNGVR